MENFFGCGDTDWQRRLEMIEASKQPDPKTLIKNQFVLDKTHSQTQKQPQLSNLHQIKFSTQPLSFNYIISPSVIEVSAKRVAPIWKTAQYNDEAFRRQLNNTVHRQIFQYDAEIAQKLRSDKHNIRVTNISEYSNALNRGSVFINPKFSSC
ncbi:UNKNOWN [Stylonychia lemnae]|uniref:Uncharacterized protein n=1 Tax=Stylonychia lemnae TaxID=5949 RepID=A0A077ZUP6_STYLE|nr:UNKNOWN [Stylonychia lemnae]|eukprot:CDW73633.1 UNKNOWN [Stylonychia lemnae]